MRLTVFRGQKWHVFFLSLFSITCAVSPTLFQSIIVVEANWTLSAQGVLLQEIVAESLETLHFCCVPTLLIRGFWIVVVVFAISVFFAPFKQRLITFAGPHLWVQQIEAFRIADAQRPPEPGSILFVGSSSIRGWESLEADMHPWKVLNRGFGGAILSDVLYFAPQIVVPYRPKIIVLYAGDNDISLGRTPEMVEADFKKFVNLVRQKLEATTKIVFVSIKPSRQRWSFWTKMKEANQRIETFCRQEDDLYFVDIASPMLTHTATQSDSIQPNNSTMDAKDLDGPPMELFVADGVHMSDIGYEIWTKHIRAMLSSLQ